MNVSLATYLHLQPLQSFFLPQSFLPSAHSHFLQSLQEQSFPSAHLQSLHEQFSHLQEAGAFGASFGASSVWPKATMPSIATEQHAVTNDLIIK